VIENNLLPPVLFLLISFLSLWQHLPFDRNVYWLGKYFGYALQWIGASTFIWAIEYEIFHHFVVQYWKVDHESRKWWRIFEWLLGPPIISFLYSALPCGVVCLFKWRISSIQNFKYEVAPKPSGISQV
jgi:hypothetical protein